MEIQAESAAGAAAANHPGPANVRKPPEDSRRYRFDDMKLRVGDRLHLQLPARVTSERLTARVIGFVEARMLLITMPESRTGRLPLVEGEVVVVRAFCGRTAFGFKCTVDRVVRAPMEYVTLSFPDNIQGVNIRKSLRVKTHVPVTVRMPDRPELTGTICNISTTGALVTTPAPLGEPGACVRVGFHISLFDLDLSLDLKVLIRSITSGPNASAGAGTHHHGVEFEDLRPNDRLALHSLIYQQLTDNPESVA